MMRSGRIMAAAPGPKRPDLTCYFRDSVERDLGYMAGAR